MRILIAGQSEAMRQTLAARIADHAQARVIGVARDLSETYTCAEHEVPNLVLIEIGFAQLPEFEVLCLLFRALSIRCVLIGQDRVTSPMEERIAARAGLTVASPDATLRTLLAPENAPSTKALKSPSGSGRAGSLQFDDGLILLGASTGGVDALITVLSSFPKTCPATLIVQHTGARFTSGLAQLIDGHVAPRVAEARAGQRPQAGDVLFAPGGTHHLVVSGALGRVSCRADPGTPMGGHRPAVDKLFLSAVPLARKVSAALLTGMGRDGAEGLLALRKAGARTFGQDAKTAVVYGMPKVAQDIGAVERQLPIQAIGPALLSSRQVNT